MMFMSSLIEHIPVCWQKLIKQHPLAHLQPTYASILLWLLQHAPDRYCQRRKLSPKTNNSELSFTSIIFEQFSTYLCVLEVMSP